MDFVLGWLVPNHYFQNDPYRGKSGRPGFIADDDDEEGEIEAEDDEDVDDAVEVIDEVEQSDMQES